MIHSKGLVYAGSVKDSVPDGIGTLTSPDGSTFTAVWSGWSHNSGPFSATSATHDHYEGGGKDFSRNGFGVMNLENGTVYKGEWLDNRPDGQGVMIKADGTRYEGTWRQGCFSDGDRKTSLFAKRGSCP